MKEALSQRTVQVLLEDGKDAPIAKLPIGELGPAGFRTLHPLLHDTKRIEGDPAMHCRNSALPFERSGKLDRARSRLYRSRL